MVHDKRHGVFLDYNQNAKDRTTCSAYSVRPLPDARVSTPLTWDEVPDCEPADFTLFTVPKRFAELGDPSADMDHHVGTLDGLLEIAARDAKSGVADAPWPGQFREGRRARESLAGAPTETPAVKPAAVRTSRREATAALLVIAKSADRDAALAGLQRWLRRHADVAAYLKVEDILVDSMRGRSTNWTRVRINLHHVPVGQRPKQERADPDQEPR